MNQTKNIRLFSILMAFLLSLSATVAVFAVADYDSAADPLISRSFLIQYINDNVLSVQEVKYAALEAKLAAIEELIKASSGGTGAPGEGSEGGEGNEGSGGANNESTLTTLLNIISQLEDLEIQMTALVSKNKELESKYNGLQDENKSLKSEIASLKDGVNKGLCISPLIDRQILHERGTCIIITFIKEYHQLNGTLA